LLAVFAPQTREQARRLHGGVRASKHLPRRAVSAGDRAGDGSALPGVGGFAGKE
jgi:hypothetical protein